MKPSNRYLLATGVVALLFVALLVILLTVDVAPIGPLGSEVGLSGMNAAVRDAIGTSDVWYTITEVLGIASLFGMGAFAVLGVWQLCTRKRFCRVDSDLYLLAALYTLLALCYLLFEVWVVNYRPILTDGALAASFPSSHTMLTIVVALSAAWTLARRLALRPAMRNVVCALCIAVAVIATVGRLLSGVHWFSDILGGVLLAAALVCAFFAVQKRMDEREPA